jgi:tetratricopeptide (TPR) repeat protein
MDVGRRWEKGEVILDLYEVQKVVRSGGMGLVYRVYHRGWDVELAVKTPRPALLQSPKSRLHFEREAESWVGLGLHPHTVSCAYVRRVGDVPAVFAEWVDGGSLREWIDNRSLYEGEAPEVLGRILDITIQMAWGIGHAHGRDLVHRDIKPENVMLDRDGDMITAKITDFGMAHHRDASGFGMTTRYASPEQQAEREPVAQTTDIYSFAVSVLEMCAGKATWDDGRTAGGKLVDYRARDAAVAVAIPQALGNLLAECLREHPSERPDSMAGVAAELIDIYQGVTGHAYPRPAPVMAHLLADEHNNRALSLLDLNRPAEAEAAFGQALAADSQHVRAIYNAGLVRWRRGDITDDALVTEIESIRAHTGDHWEVRFALAQIHLERGDLGAARAYLSELASRRPDERDVSAALSRIHSGEILDAGLVREWQVPWRREGYVVPLALTPDGRFMLTGERDGRIRLYDVGRGQCVCSVGTRRAKCTRLTSPRMDVSLPPPTRTSPCGSGT